MKKWIYLFLVFVLFFSSCAKSSDEIPAEDKPEAIETPIQEESKEDEIPAAEESTPEFFPWHCEDFTIEIGKEIGFFYTWISKTDEQNTEFFEAAKHEITINGVPVNPINEGIGEPEVDEEGNPKQLYWAVIGDFPPGTYELVNTIEITEPVFDGWDWYGPESDYPLLESSCTMTVTGVSGDAQASEEEIPSPSEKTCSISSPIHEDWETTLCETFDSSTTLWTGDREGTTARVEGGKYILDNSTKVAQGYTTGFIFPVTAGQARDHMVSVDGTMESNYQNCTWGVFVRSLTNEIVYFFMINNSGRYMLTGSSDREASRYLGNIDSGANKAIVWDGTNNLTAVADGDQMEFYVNGELIISHEAINSENPYFGLIVWGGEGVSALNRFDNLLVRVK